MEPFSLLKFWRTTGDSAATVVDVRSRAPDTDADSDSDAGSDSDSFFDLELTRSTVPPEEDSIGNLIEMECPVRPEPVSTCKPQSPISLLKSGPKFRVFLLSFRKPKSERPEPEPVSQKAVTSTPGYFKEQRSRRFSSSSEEDVPIGSLISSDNSLRTKLQRERSADFSGEEPAAKALPKYLKLIKPLYNRASRRYTAPDFPRGGSPSWDQFSAVSPLSSPATLPPCSPRKLPEERRGSLGSGFRVVTKHLGKSRSGSSTGVVTSSPAVARRRDDTLLLQNDGIQSAILHCKKSFNSTPSSMLRACHEKSMSDTIEFNFERYRCSSL